MSKSTWPAIAQRKQAERQSRIPKAWLLPSLPSSGSLDVRSIPRTCGILSPKELEITEKYDATSLSEAIALRRYSAEDVTTAFCKRASIAQQLCNCLTEIFFEDAITRAKELDRIYEKSGKVVGPLHGIPVSLKDSFRVKGYESSIGIASLVGSPATTNSLLVDILLEQGAVIYCKTNVPQTLGALDSDNNVFGRVLNPRNRLVTAGGSTGGEGALIAMRGSVLGVGTDVGGSIRIPAMCGGLYGIKPSTQRIPYVGQEDGTRVGTKKVGLQASAGPIAVSLRDCELFMKAVSGSKPWERDPAVAYGHWSEQGYKLPKSVDAIPAKRLLGVIRTDGLITPLPPVSKVLDETVQILRNHGDVDVVEIDPPALKRCQSLANALLGVSGSNFMFDLLEKTGEPLINWLSTRIRRSDGVSLEKVTELFATRVALETEMLKIWKDPASGRIIEAIICPVAPHPVPPIDRWNGVSYTISFNLLDYPAGTIPIRDFEESDLIGDLPSNKPLNSWDKANMELWDPKTIDRKVYLNTTLSIQVVAPRMEERRLYEAMQMIDSIVNNKDSSKQDELSKKQAKL